MKNPIMKSVMLAASLAVLSSSAVLANGPTDNPTEEGSSSLNPRDYNGDSIPVNIGSLVASAFSKIDIGAVSKEMEQNGETERVVVSKVTLEGALAHWSPEGYRSKNNFQNMRKYRTMLLPFKIEIESDGSISKSVGAFGFQDNSDFDMNDFAGWVKVRDFRFLNYTESKDEFTGNEESGLGIFDLQADIGLLELDNSAFYLKTGLKLGGKDKIYTTQDGQKVELGSSSYEYKAGLHYEYGSRSDFHVDIGAGYKSQNGEGSNSLSSDTSLFNSQVAHYDLTRSQYESDKADFAAQKEMYELSQGYEVGTLSNSSFASIMGIQQPSFGLDQPELQRTRLNTTRNSYYGSIKAQKYLADQNIQIGFYANVEAFQDNEVSGMNALEQEVILGLQDKSRVNAGIEVKF